jgi:uncharacterized protein with HEPN domain
MKRDITLYVSDILENIADAGRFISGLTFEQFVKDKMVVNAVVRSIEIVGEATKHVPAEIRARRPDVPWKDMAGMRDKCIHDYVGIDYEVVWTAVKVEFPEVRSKIQSLLDELKNTSQKQ